MHRKLAGFSTIFELECGRGLDQRWPRHGAWHRATRLGGSWRGRGRQRELERTARDRRDRGFDRCAISAHDRRGFNDLISRRRGFLRRQLRLDRCTAHWRDQTLGNNPAIAQRQTLRLTRILNRTHAKQARDLIP